MNRLPFLALALMTATTAVHANAPETGIRATDGTCQSANTGPEHDGAHDFHFLSGRSWKITGRKRVGRFMRSDRWEVIDGFDNSRRVGDMGMIDEVTFPKWRPDYKLVILRIYDPLKRTWSIYDAHDSTQLSPPLNGSFHQGLGLFVGDDQIDGQPVKVRYIWTCDWVHPRYQQEFSNDGGKTWEIDWQMEFTENR